MISTANNGNTAKIDSALIIAIVAALAATWHFSRSVDVSIRTEQQGPENTFLPVSTDAQIVLSLKNEDKTADSLTVGGTVRLKNIPRRFIGREVRCRFSASNYLPVDTLLTLKTVMTLPVSRDEQVFGSIRLRLRGNKPSDKVTIAGQPVTPAADNTVELFIPAEHQRTAYPVLINGQLQPDSIYMPCGENDIFIIE